MRNVVLIAACDNKIGKKSFEEFLFFDSLTRGTHTGIERGAVMRLEQLCSIEVLILDFFVTDTCEKKFKRLFSVNYVHFEKLFDSQNFTHVI